jgi:hypothetical protein
MESLSQKVLHVLGSNSVYSIPPYQRQYQWNEDLWQALAHDVAIASKLPESEPAHWLGILLLTTDEAVKFPNDDSLAKFSVIDGQQRLVTLVIWLSALYWHAKDNKQEITFELDKIAPLNVQKVDETPLRIVLTNKWLEHSSDIYRDSQVLEAYTYFRFILWLGENALMEEQTIKLPKFVKPDNQVSLNEIWTKYLNSRRGKELKRSNPVNCQNLVDVTRKRLKVFTLIHDPSVDEPQAIIFDTLNGNRVQLEALDHVRNSVFVRLDTQTATSLFDRYWQPAEHVLRDLKLKRQKPGVNFIYDYVISKGEKKKQGTINKGKGAAHFTRMTRNLKDDALSDFIINDLVPAMQTWPIVVRQRDTIDIDGTQTKVDAKILEVISTIRELSAGPVNPLVLLYLSAYLRGELSINEVMHRFNLIENYLVRLILSNEPLSPLRSKMMDICGAIDESLDEMSLQNALLAHGWVQDENIKNGFELRNLYEQAEPAALGAIFRGIETNLSGYGANKFKVAKNLYTIEHIFPRKADKWKKDLRLWKTDKEKMQPYLHTLGNLTVVTAKHNSAVGNKTLKEKQKFPKVLGNSAPLRIHEDWEIAGRWTEVEIAKRSTKFLNKILIHWPNLPANQK